VRRAGVPARVFSVPPSSTPVFLSKPRNTLCLLDPFFEDAVGFDDGLQVLGDVHLPIAVL
jgi:hypothetical protein